MAIPAGTHPFPSRTRPLRPPGPMILLTGESRSPPGFYDTPPGSKEPGGFVFIGIKNVQAARKKPKPIRVRPASAQPQIFTANRDMRRRSPETGSHASKKTASTASGVSMDGASSRQLVSGQCSSVNGRAVSGPSCLRRALGGSFIRLGSCRKQRTGIGHPIHAAS